MADIDSNKFPQNIFKPHSWGKAAINDVALPGSAVLTFIEKVEAIASGSQVIMEIAASNQVDKAFYEDGEAPQPYLNDGHISIMMALVKNCMQMLSTEAYTMEKWAYEHHTKEGAVDRYKSAAFSLKCQGEPLPKLD